MFQEGETHSHTYTHRQTHSPWAATIIKLQCWQLQRTSLENVRRSCNLVSTQQRVRKDNVQGKHVSFVGFSLHNHRNQERRETPSAKTQCHCSENQLCCYGLCVWRKVLSLAFKTPNQGCCNV